MNRVLLLDDRVDRINNHMSLAAIKELYNLCDSDNLKIVSDLPLDLDSLKSLFDYYSMLILHRSYLLDNGMLNVIEEYSKNKNIFLIIFSGGISQNLILNNRMRLNINSANLYTSNFPSFIRSYINGDIDEPLLQLLYGDNWRKVLLINLRNLCWMPDPSKSIKKLKKSFLSALGITQDNVGVEHINKLIDKEENDIEI